MRILEKILSWSPVLLFFLVALFLWVFLFQYRGPEGGEKLLQKACPEEKPEKLNRDPFVIIYRTGGCASVSSLAAERLAQDLLWWEKSAKQFRLPEPRQGTSIDIQPGKPLTRFQLGQPGALRLPPAEINERRYRLAKGLNFLIISEAFPRKSKQTLDVVAGSLALDMLGRDRFRIIAPEDEINLQIASYWPGVLISCSDPCSLSSLRQRIEAQS